MPTIICTRKTKVAAQLKSSRMLLALRRRRQGNTLQSTMDREAEGSENYRATCSTFVKFSNRSFSLLLVQDGVLGKSCLPFLSINCLMSAIVGLIVSLNSS